MKVRLVTKTVGGAVVVVLGIVVGLFGGPLLVYYEWDNIKEKWDDICSS